MFGKKIRRIALLIIVVLLLGSGGFTAYIAYSVYFGPLPKTSGEGTVDGLNDTVTIYRDNWGVPHIYATNVEDLFFAQGYVQAQERWWQMELIRYLGMGRLSEILTDHDVVENADHLMLTLGWAEIAKARWEHVSPETKLALESYSSGINAYIQSRNAEDLASEYGLLGISGEYDHLLAYWGRDVEVEIWEPYHSLLLMTLMSWGMDGNFWAELDNAALYDQLSPDLLTSYRPEYPYDTHPTILSDNELDLTNPDFASDSTNPWVSPSDVDLGEAFSVLRTLLVGDATPELMAMLGFRTIVGGNAWVVNGEHTESGKPLLANDLHMPIEIPSTWFEIGLHCVNFGVSCPYNVVGFTLAGIPGVVVGHNEQIAWGINILKADVQDIYLLRLNPDNPLQYEYNGQWVDMERHETQVAVEDEDNEDPSFITTYSSHFGPVITTIDDAFSYDELQDADYQALALDWTVTDAEGDTLSAILAVNRAQNWTEFRAGLQSWSLTPLGFMYADVNGNIGLQVAGKIPIRRAGHSGILPVLGWTSNYEWQGTIPFDALTSVYNPTDGMIVSANNALMSQNSNRQWAVQLATQYPKQFSDADNLNVVVSHAWSQGFRAARIEAVLASIEQESVDSFARIQGDNHNLFAQQLLPYLFELSFDDEEFQSALDWLKEWDLQNHMDSPQAALFQVFWAEVVRLTFTDQLGHESTGLEDDMWAVVRLAETPRHEWWDDINTPFTHESRDDIFERAFVNAYDDLVEAFGKNRTAWRWGELHTGQFVSKIIGQDGFLPNNPAVNNGPFPINRGPFEMSGGTGIVNETTFIIHEDGLDEPFATLTLPSYRMIIDLGDFGNSRAMHTTGQSGHPASDHYRDMIDPWRAVEYHDMYWGAAEIRNVSTKRLELLPQ